jgi:hypothetical protein
MAIYPTAYDALGVSPGTTKMCRLVSAWGASEAHVSCHAFCQALRLRMIRRLPGYEAAAGDIQCVKSGTLGCGDDAC